MPEITLPAKLESVGKAMIFIKQNLLDLKLAHLAGKVELAVEELLLNVINYAYNTEFEPSKKKDLKILVGCRLVNLDGVEQFCVWLRDWGLPFDPFKEVATPDISLSVEEREIGGLGVHLVKNVSSHYMYSGSDGSNTVELYFRLDEAQA
ncbi:MAG: ATP-binding protein [Desulfovibrionaceae bacterium]|nr:ATP-binding protein [Desulfovibrionaceae bacterium]